MSDDLSPMLSQSADDVANRDNAPMISGQGTKVIADARGAYLAGNFGGLAAHLTPAAAKRLHEVFARHVIDLMRYATEHRTDAAQVQGCLQTVESWLANPISEDAHRCEEIFIEMGLIAEASMYPLRQLSLQPQREGWFGYMVGASLNVILSEDLIEAAKNASFVATCLPMVRQGKPLGAPGLMEESRRLSNSSQRWQCEAAWALIQGKEPPPFVIEGAS